MKTCTLCGKEKQFSDFSRHPTTADKLQPVCKLCASIINKKRYLAKRDEILKKVNEYRITNASKISESKKQYYENTKDIRKLKSNEWYLANKEKAKENNAKWREKNRDRANKYSRKWVSENIDKRKATAILSDGKRRAKTRCGTITKDIREKLFVQQNGLCIICDIDLSTTKVHLDHIHPLAKGGAHEDSNLQLLCAKCNLRKSSKTDYHI